jgi:hypothetical protein
MNPPVPLELIPVLDVGGQDIRVRELIATPELARTVSSHLGHSKRSGELYGEVLQGGVVIQGSGWWIDRAGCCSDLSAVYDWQKAVTNQSTEWAYIGGGFEGVYTRCEDGLFTITDLTEVETRQPPVPMISGIPAAALLSAFQRAAAEVEELRSDIFKLLQSMGYKEEAVWLTPNLIGY